MTALSILDLKAFTAQLFARDGFDSFFVQEATVVTACSFTIDGRIPEGYYSEEELSSLPDRDFSMWQAVRPLCYEIIKGKRLPKSFRIILGLPKGQIPGFLRRRNLSFLPEQVGGLYLNIRYEKDKLQVVTGTALNGFFPDKSLEQEWDASIKQFFQQRQIAFEEI